MLNNELLKGMSISHGTLRTEDLIESFTEFLSAIEIPVLSYEEWLEGTAASDELESEYLNEYLFNKLDSISPEGYYFGAHMGDGSDFGFWQCDDE